MPTQAIPGIIFLLFYLVFVIGITIFFLWLIWRFVSAHEKMAASLDIIARKLKDEAKP